MLGYIKPDPDAWQDETMNQESKLNSFKREMLLQCNDCDFHGLSRRELSRHLRESHLHHHQDEDERSGPGILHVCPRCSRGYKYRHHMRTHYLHECGKEPKYQCPFCEHKAKQKSNLTTHMFRKHPDEPLVNKSGYTRSKK